MFEWSNFNYHQISPVNLEVKGLTRVERRSDLLELEEAIRKIGESVELLVGFPHLIRPVTVKATHWAIFPDLNKIVCGRSCLCDSL